LGVIVVDASVVVQTLLRLPGADAVEARLLAAQSVHAPHHMELEVLQTIRRVEHRGEIAEASGKAAVGALKNFRVNLHDNGDLLLRVWALRRNLTCYDAAYVALAEFLDAPLLTRDRRLAAAPSHSARIEVI
jgi:predicted nucleic acid-binding protein